ncbi:MAG: hypothetical protein PHR03_04130 [Desulfovibrionales bacterium]|nr:hypothetical protein [Desulfovibrionales bacterium]
MKGIIKRFEDVMAAVAFAEEGEHKTAMEIMGYESYPVEKQRTEAAGLKLEKKASEKLMDKIDRVAEAATFAEVGEHVYARKVMGERLVEIREGGRILVVGRECSFSDHLMEYATNMAKRMGRDIVALNVTQSDLAFRFLPTYHQTVREDFRLHAAKSAEDFRNKAAEKGLGFEHLVKFSDPDQAMQTICDKIGEITYVLTEPEIRDAEERTAALDEQADILVFCVSPRAAA